MSSDLRAAPHASQLKTIVGLFVVLRVTILFLYTPQGLLNAYTDYHHYFRTAQLSDQGYWPFVNMWSEYPPLLTYTTQAVYSLARSIVPMNAGVTGFGYQIFARLLGGVLLLFETGVLILIHRLGTKTWGLEKADWLAWVYSGLSLPLFFWNASQTSNITFFTLLAIYWFIDRRYGRSAAALALGVLIKFTPIFLLGPVVRELWPRRREIIRYAVIVAVVSVLVFAPLFLMGGGPWIVASFQSMAVRASWATPWALIDGNWGAGDVGDIPTRTQLDLATTIHGHPSAIPGFIPIAAFGLLYAFFLRRPIDQRSPRQFIGFVTFTAMLFHLWSKGWSPQWATLIVPLLLLSFPDRRGLTLTLLLTALVFIEWPLSDALRSPGLLAGAIIGRTLLFSGVAVMTARQLWPSPSIRTPSPTVD
jgi:hypothetical protein